jgi:hypothetical protein
MDTSGGAFNCRTISVEKPVWLESVSRDVDVCMCYTFSQLPALCLPYQLVRERSETCLFGCFWAVSLIHLKHPIKQLGVYITVITLFESICIFLSFILVPSNLSCSMHFLWHLQCVIYEYICARALTCVCVWMCVCECVWVTVDECHIVISLVGRSYCFPLLVR